MNNLIIIAHPDKQSFCQNGIFKTIYNTLTENKENVDVIDLYEEKFNVFGDEEKTNLYKDMITKSNRIYIISPVWWFRCTPLLESFFDQVLSPGFPSYSAGSELECDNSGPYRLSRTAKERSTYKKFLRMLRGI
jgi:putative NADPH-quinone reductase